MEVVGRLGLRSSECGDLILGFAFWEGGLFLDPGVKFAWVSLDEMWHAPCAFFAGC